MSTTNLSPGENSGIYEINVTPIIDVALVLVIILLLATPLAFESSIALRRAAKTAASAQVKSNDDRVEIRVMTDRDVMVNRAKVTRERLTATLQPLLQASTSRLVVLSCDDGVSHGAFVDVLDQSKLAGAAEIAVTEK